MKALKKLYALYLMWDYLRINKSLNWSEGVFNNKFIYELPHNEWFFYPSTFADRLPKFLGKEIATEKIHHYILTDRFNDTVSFPAWCYQDKDFIFFAEVGERVIYLSHRNFYRMLFKRTAEVRFSLDDDDIFKNRKFLVKYKIIQVNNPQPTEVWIEDAKGKKPTFLCSISNNEYMGYAIERILDWKKKQK